MTLNFNVVESLTSQLSNREISLLAWLLIVCISVMLYPKTRSPLKGIIKLVFGYKFLIVYILAGAYISLLCYTLQSTNIWNLKDFLFWLFGVAIVLLFKANTFKSTDHFKTLFLDGIKVTVLVEFIVNFYSFNLVLEFFSLPILLLIVGIQTFANNDPKAQDVHKVFTFILNGIGLAYIGFSVFQTINNAESFFSTSTLQSFLIPILLTLGFLPFIYFLSFYMKVETYFIRLDFMANQPEKVRRVKRYVLQMSLFSMSRLNQIMFHLEKDIFYDDINLKKHIKEISKKPVPNNS